MAKFDEPIGPVPPLDLMERRIVRNGIAVLVVLVALMLFVVVSI